MSSIPFPNKHIVDTKVFHSLELLSMYNVQERDKSVVSVKDGYYVCRMTFSKTGSLAKCTKDSNNGLRDNVNIQYSLQYHHLNNKNMELSLTSKSGNGRHDCEMP